jgi:hypothetical protein
MGLFGRFPSSGEQATRTSGSTDPEVRSGAEVPLRLRFIRADFVTVVATAPLVVGCDDRWPRPSSLAPVQGGSSTYPAQCATQFLADDLPGRTARGIVGGRDTVAPRTTAPEAGRAPTIRAARTTSAPRTAVQRGQPRPPTTPLQSHHSESRACDRCAVDRKTGRLPAGLGGLSYDLLYGFKAPGCAALRRARVRLPADRRSCLGRAPRAPADRPRGMAAEPRQPTARSRRCLRRGRSDSEMTPTRRRPRVHRGVRGSSHPTCHRPGQAERTRPRASRSFVQWRAPP